MWTEPLNRRLVTPFSRAAIATSGLRPSLIVLITSVASAFISTIVISLIKQILRLMTASDLVMLRRCDAQTL